MKPSYLLSALALAIAAPAMADEPPPPPLEYVNGHADLRPGYYDSETKAFVPGWHFDTGIFDQNRYAPEEVIAIVSSTRSAPLGAEAVFGSGGTLFVAGSSSFQPNLGFAVHDLNPDDWETVDFGGIELPAVMATLTAWSGPGEFALFTTNLAGTTFTDVFYSTFAPASTYYDNTLEIILGDHQHFLWGFTEAGTYDITLTWWGTHRVDGLIETKATYRFVVIPEPSTFALLAAGLLGAPFLSRFRKKRISSL